jgi:hypothetical protein
VEQAVGGYYAWLGRDIAGYIVGTAATSEAQVHDLPCAADPAQLERLAAVAPCAARPGLTPPPSGRTPRR